MTYLKWQLAGKGGNGDEIIENFIKEDAELTKEVLAWLLATLAS